MQAWAAPGLDSVVSGRTSLAESIEIDPHTGLAILASQSPDNSGTEPRVYALSDQTLRASYDVVILDVPPIVIAADARFIAPLADTILFVVRWNRTKRAAVLDGLSDLQWGGVTVSGIVLNAVRERAARALSTSGRRHALDPRTNYTLG